MDIKKVTIVNSYKEQWKLPRNLYIVYIVKHKIFLRSIRKGGQEFFEKICWNFITYLSTCVKRLINLNINVEKWEILSWPDKDTTQGRTHTEGRVTESEVLLLKSGPTHTRTRSMVYRLLMNQNSRCFTFIIINGVSDNKPS